MKAETQSRTHSCAMIARPRTAALSPSTPCFCARYSVIACDCVSRTPPGSIQYGRFGADSPRWSLTRSQSDLSYAGGGPTSKRTSSNSTPTYWSSSRIGSAIPRLSQ